MFLVFLAVTYFPSPIDRFKNARNQWSKPRKLKNWFITSSLNSLLSTCCIPSPVTNALGMLEKPSKLLFP